MEKKISDMMDHIIDDTVDIKVLDVASCEKIKEVTMSKLHKKTNTFSNKRKMPRTLLIAVIIVLTLSVGALAYAGIVGWFSPHRNADTEMRAQAAQDALGAFSDALTSSAAPVETQGADKLSASEARLSSMLNDDGQFDMALCDYAAEGSEGSISYYFDFGTPEENADNAWVCVAPGGAVTLLDMRAAFPYAAPEDAPAEYFTQAYDWEILDGEFVLTPNGKMTFLEDLYLQEVAYPDVGLYRETVEPAALDAIALLYNHGLLSEGTDKVDCLYFERFNGGSAWVSALMDSGSVYSVFLQPDDLSILGFKCMSPEMASDSWYMDWFDAMSNGTMEQFNDARRAEIASSVG